MLEKDAEEIAKDIYIHHFDDDINYPDVLKAITVGVQKGAEHGYNKAKVEVEDSYRESLCNSELNLASVTEQLEELNKANEWQFVSEKGLPKESGRYLVYVGGGENGVYPLDFETEYNDFGYWCLIVNSASLGVTDTIFETITERNEDKVIAWKEIVLPKED